jgi:hypothetical protein
MLASITPLGERGRRSRWGITTAWYVTGSVAGGTAVGALAGLFGSFVIGGVATRARLALLAATLAAGLVWELARGWVPEPRRQVNERWLDSYRSWLYGVGFGVQLGAGVTTVVVSSAVYAVPVAAFASANVVTGAAIGAIAGLLRGATLLIGGRIVSPQRLLSFHERMHGLERPVRNLALAVQLLLAGLTALWIA